MKLLLTLLLSLSSAWAADPGWHRDDYPAARAAAREAGHLLVLDLWAPWCHTCLALQATVLRDPRLTGREGLTWLALDTDRPANRAAVERFPPAVWPTFFVVDPVSERVLGRLQGSASVAQFTAFLDAAHAQQPPDSPDALARAGDQLAAQGRPALAEAAYRRALAEAPAGWPRRPGLLVDQISQRLKLGDPEGCAELGGRGLDAAVVGHTPSAADFVYYLYTCATQRPRTEALAEILRRAATHLEAVHADAAAPLSLDDRSELLRVLRDTYWAVGEHAKARSTAMRQATLLEQGVASMPPAEAMAYGWPRAEVHVYLGRGWQIEPKLAAIADALPEAYDPAYRLAWVRHALHREGPAEQAAQRALATVYGPRTLRVLRLLAEIQTARGDDAGARTTWQRLRDLAAAERATPSVKAMRAAAEAALR